MNVFHVRYGTVVRYGGTIVWYMLRRVRYGGTVRWYDSMVHASDGTVRWYGTEVLSCVFTYWFGHDLVSMIHASLVSNVIVVTYCRLTI